MTSPEQLGAMSHVLDMTEGLPAGHSARSAFIALRCTGELGITAQAKRNLFYSVRLKNAGCSGNAARLCEIYRAGDLKLKRDFRTVGPSLADTQRYMLTQTAPGAGYRARARAILNTMRNASARPLRPLRRGERIAADRDLRSELVPTALSAAARHLANRRSQCFAPNADFDHAFYMARHGATLGPNRDPFAHFLLEGLTRDLDPSPGFDAAAYRAGVMSDEPGKPIDARPSACAHAERQIPLVHFLDALP